MEVVTLTVLTVEAIALQVNEGENRVWLL